MYLQLLRALPALFLVVRDRWVAPDWILNLHLDVEELELALMRLGLVPAWFQSSYLDREGLGLVLVALILA